MRLHVVTPEEGVLVERLDVSSVTATGVLGEFVLLPGHEPFLTALAPGRFSFTEFERTHHFFAGGGFLQIVNDTVRILAESLIPMERLSLTAATEELEKAVHALEAARGQSEEYEARLESLVAAARVKVAMARRRQAKAHRP